MEKISSQDSTQFRPLTVVGLMSGTSTDGLDMVAVSFNTKDEKIVYTIEETRYIPYSDAWKSRLLNAPAMTGRELCKLDIELGLFFSECVSEFISGAAWKASLIGSHGHTVFHVPSESYTHQIGCGATLAVKTGIPAICDFRQGDVALGGQGAPLVPLGDELLFPEYAYCVNLGGFANVSCIYDGKRVAWDICPLNVIMNQLAGEAGYTYDPEGKLASSGKMIPGLWDELESIEYYKLAGPKSLGTEWTEANILPILKKYRYETPADKLHTYTMHAAKQIGASLQSSNSKALLSGGGSLNKFLVSHIQTYANSEIIEADPTTRDFKEALIFALLAWLRWQGRNSTISSVTGASRSHPAGALYLP